MSSPVVDYRRRILASDAARSQVMASLPFAFLHVAARLVERFVQQEFLFTGDGEKGEHLAAGERALPRGRRASSCRDKAARLAPPAERSGAEARRDGRRAAQGNLVSGGETIDLDIRGT
jgi:hypothetical protein